MVKCGAVAKPLVPDDFPSRSALDPRNYKVFLVTPPDRNFALK